MQTLANIFSVGGAILGLPSLAVLGLYIVQAVRLRFAAPPAVSEPVKNPDAILMILGGMTKAITAAASVIGSFGQFVLGGLAIVAAGMLVFATACWFTGRGLHAHAGWARVSAIILLLSVMLPALLLALSLHNLGRAVMVVIVVGCAFALRTVWQGYPGAY